MKSVFLESGNEHDFFRREMTLAHLADTGTPLPEERTVSFEDLSRSAVKRDVDQLAQAGLLTIETKILPGLGHMKKVRAAASSFRLEAMVM